MYVSKRLVGLANFMGSAAVRIPSKLPARSIGGLALACLFVPLCATLTASTAHALPWDIDMYKQQSLKANEIARNPVPGTVPLGSTRVAMTTEESTEKRKNPVEFDRDSIWRGQRIWSVNCYTCHGAIAGEKRGPAGDAMGVPSLQADAYKQKTDGYIYGVLQNGGSNMPRYGYKFSDQEHWDVINYVRFLQGRELQGFPRPVE